MKNNKNKLYLFFILIVGIVYCLAEAEGNGDFYIFMWASGELSKHLNIYDHKYINSYSYYYSVLFALILEPFYFISFYWVKFGWLLLNLGALCHLFYLLIKSKILEHFNSKQSRIFYICLLLFAFRFIHENIHHAQITILMLWTCVYGLYCIYHQKGLKGSLILAIGINIKLFPLVFLPYLIYRGFFKEVALTCMFYLGFMFFPSIIIGHEYNLTLIKSWWVLINPSNTNHVLDVDERSFHGLSTLLSTLFVQNVPDMYALPIKRNLFDVSLPVFVKILLVVRLLIIALTLKFLQWPPFKRPDKYNNVIIEISYILMVIPLIFPHQQHYAFIFICPAFAICLYTLIANFMHLSKFKRNSICIMMTFIFICSSLKIWLGEFNEYYEHFKVLTYGALLLIPLLIWTTNFNKSAKHIL